MCMHCTSLTLPPREFDGYHVAARRDIEAERDLELYQPWVNYHSLLVGHIGGPTIIVPRPHC